jgi:hypothetical protein
MEEIRLAAVQAASNYQSGGQGFRQSMIRWRQKELARNVRIDEYKASKLRTKLGVTGCFKLLDRTSTFIQGPINSGYSTYCRSMTIIALLIRTASNDMAPPVLGLAARRRIASGLKGPSRLSCGFRGAVSLLAHGLFITIAHRLCISRLRQERLKVHYSFTDYSWPST